MSTTQKFKELTETTRPQDPHGNGTGLHFETGKHGGHYPHSSPPLATRSSFASLPAKGGEGAVGRAGHLGVKGEPGAERRTSIGRGATSTYRDRSADLRGSGCQRRHRP